MTAIEDTRHLDQIVAEVRAYLNGVEKVPLTLRNIIHAMYAMHYADWLGGEEFRPMCNFDQFTMDDE